MYFTRFPINKTRRDSMRILSSPYRLHAAIAGSFPTLTNSNGEGRVLWRIDDNQDGSRVLYIVSPCQPSLVGLDEQIGWPDLPPQWETRDYDPFLSQIKIGQRYAFRLTANPTVSRTKITDSNGRSKRISHLTPLHQAAWLVGSAAYEQAGETAPSFIKGRETRSERNGFTVCRDDNGTLQLVVSNMQKQVFRQGDTGRRLTIARAQYDGVLQVTDAEKLVHALCNGIGHAKGFGCGLMTLVPIK